ncbi:integrase core domain-containing protein [Luteolibacter arcticus]|uniref:integrase core domain-containing protein n=1 Tax=Luteolibacter arcticus TaxID=1581411 RepID=UPI003F6DF2B0
MLDLIFHSCVYTIRHSETLRVSVKAGGSGTFEEARRWVAAVTLLSEAKAAGQLLPVLFAHAEDTSSGVTCWAVIDSLELHDSGTRVHLLRDECLNTHLFWDIPDAQSKLDRWQKDYNEDRPHGSLGSLSPAEFAKQQKQRAYAGKT